MLSAVFNPCSDVLSGFLSAWNERGWIVKHQGNLKSDYQIYFFLFTFEEITDEFIVFNGMVRSIGCTPVIFTRESSLILEHLHNFFLNCF